jgi:chromosome segregation ATPase
MEARAGRIAARSEHLGNDRVRFWFDIGEVERFRSQFRIEPNRSQLDVRDAQILDHEARIRDLVGRVAELTSQVASMTMLTEAQAQTITALNAQIELMTDRARTEADGPGARG